MDCTPFAPFSILPRPVMEEETFESILSLACRWALEQEQFILARGVSLGPEHLADALRAGVQDPSSVRVLVVDRIPLPENEQLAEVARKTQILTTASRGCVFGYGIIIRADSWGHRELLLHQLVHVAQYERTHDLEACIREYICNRTTCAKFTTGSLEDEARRIAREICAADTDTTK
jgi:hypothetical protein